MDNKIAFEIAKGLNTHTTADAAAYAAARQKFRNAQADKLIELMAAAQ